MRTCCNCGKPNHSLALRCKECNAPILVSIKRYGKAHSKNDALDRAEFEDKTAKFSTVVTLGGCGLAGFFSAIGLFVVVVSIIAFEQQSEYSAGIRFSQEQYTPPVNQPQPLFESESQTTAVPPVSVIADRLKSSIVRVSYRLVEDGWFRTYEKYGSGTGVIVHSVPGVAYVVATNSHVWGYNEVARGSRLIRDFGIDVTFWDNAIASPKAIFDHVYEDIALLLIDEDIGNYPVAEVSNRLPKQGDTVYAFGHPLGLNYSLTRGMVSAIRKSDLTPGSAFHLIQTDTPISPGNSGGPLANEHGAVIGLNTFTYLAGQNLNFAISINDLMRDLRLLMEEESTHNFYLVPLDTESLYAEYRR